MAFTELNQLFNGQEENAARRFVPQLRKLSAEEELYETLARLRHYAPSGGSERFSRDHGLASSASDQSFLWTVTCMIDRTYGPLRGVIRPDTVAERAANVASLRQVYGPLACAQVIVDGTKQPARMNKHTAEANADYK